MRGSSGVAVLLLGIALSGCLGDDGKESNLPTSTGLPKYVSELPPVYVSTGELFDQNYSAPDFPRVVEIITGFRGAEPNVGVTSQGGIFITAFDSTIRSTDGGQTWERVYEFELAPGAPADPFRTSDPMLWVDPDTDRIFTFHMSPVLVCNSNIVSDDNGDTWTHFPMSCGLPVEDHQKVFTFRPRPPMTATPLYENLVMYCYNKLVSTNCATSFDGGVHFEYDTVAADANQCGGINGHPQASLDGVVFVPFGLNCGVPHVAISEDNGVTWTVREFGETNGMTEIDPEIAITPDGTAYYYGRGDDGNGYLYRSSDQFATVEGPFQVNPPDVLGVIFAGLTAGDDGRIAISYLGNREYAEDPSDAPDNTTWHLFMTYSFDANAAVPTFQTHQVTPPDDPVQIGCIWLNGGSNPCRNLLDFIDAVADKDGRVHVAFTDGCTTELSCANNPKAGPSESRSRAVALAIQDHGPSLLAAKGLLPSLGWTTQINDPTKPQ